MNPVDAYAAAVVDGLVQAGKYHRLACVRHQRDRAREHMPEFPYRFDLARAERFFRFVGLLKHYKGEWAGQPIELQPYQQFRLGSIFGWVHVETGLRRFRTSYHEIPRKNGKSLEAAVVALYLTFFDNEPGAEGYTIATKRDQARIVWGDARQLVLSSGLKTRIAVQVANLHADASASKLEPLGADHDSTDGLNPHLIVVDEFHAHKTRGLIDVMETATGARRQPHNFQITTAGDDPISPGGDQHDYACKILDGVLADESFFAFIAHADEGDDWQAEATWRKANPNYGVSVKPEDLQALALKAKSMPAAAATFKQKRLNLWVNATAPCLSVEGWRAGQTMCPGAEARAAWRAELQHQRCFVGIDLASKIDLCALSLVFPPTEDRRTWRVLQTIWTPEDTVKDRSHRDRAPYDIWVAQGWLRTTPGSRIDHAVVRQAIVEARSAFELALVGFDPWHADQLIDELVTQDGFAADRVLAVPQTYQGMSSACLRVQAEILEGNVDAGGCPVTAWAVSNAVANRDGKDNLMFAKGKSRGRIDPLIALTIGVALFLRVPTPSEPAYQMLVLR
jgi:phage terminase large subunit-like protein